MGAIKISRVEIDRTTGKEIGVKETVHHVPNLMSYDIRIPGHESPYILHGHCGGIIARKIKRIARSNHRLAKRSYAITMTHVPYGKFFCLKCANILGKQAVRVIMGNMHVVGTGFIDHTGGIDKHGHEKFEDKKYWAFDASGVRDQVVEAPLFNQKEDILPF